MGRSPWWLPCAVYGPLGALGAWLAWYQRGQVLTAPDVPWFAHSRGAALAVGLALSLLVSLLTIVSTRWLVRRTRWACDLHGTLRGALLGASQSRLLGLALASSVAEELLFRAALVPALGMFASALLFGVLHVSSRSGYLPWMTWAALMGLVFALLFTGSGSLWPPLLAHATINFENMRYLCEHEPVALATARPAPHRERWRRL